MDLKQRRELLMGQIEGMYINGPMGGKIITLPDPPPERLTVGVNRIACMHVDPTQPFPIAMLTYIVNKPSSPFMPHFITLEGEFEDIGWYCPTCKAEAEVRFKLEQN